jgi:small subunit ribosomal protein S5
MEKKHLVSVSLTKNNSVPHLTNGIAGAAKVLLRPAAEGCGVIAGGSVRTVLELAGVKNILTKQLGSSNPLNNACATVDGLKNLKTFSSTVENRKVLA